MRLNIIRETKQSLSDRVQTFSTEDISQRIVEPAVLLPREPVKRKVLRLLAPPVLRCLQPLNRRLFPSGRALPSHLVAIGGRFAIDASAAFLLKQISRETVARVLIPGCYLGGEDVQFWLRRGVKHLEGVDVYSLKERWAVIVPRLCHHYGALVRFRQATTESLPFSDGFFDLLATTAVLEHVRNLAAMVDETARVLRPGGWAWHCFGPLYHSFGADHCISAYGDCAGYDHLLLDDETYQQYIRDQTFFEKHPNANLPFWALHQQFSFATASEYLNHFNKRFHVEFLVVILSPKGLAFRRAWPEKWDTLLRAGVEEGDLLTDSVAVVLRKK